jgi:hypothetical protein
LRENNVATLDAKTRIVLGSPHGTSAHCTFGKLHYNIRVRC